MAVQDAVPGRSGSGSSSLKCPECGRDDRVLAVAAVYEASIASEHTLGRARSVLNDDDEMLSRKRAARATIAETPAPMVRSKLLAPAPGATVGGYLGGTVFFGLVAGVVWGVHQRAASNAEAAGFDPGTGNAGMLRTLALVATALAAACLLGLVVQVVRRVRIRAGRPAAEALWRRGRYCARCATVFFRAGDEPIGVEPGRTFAPQQFRNLVWTAGGYGRSQRG